MKKMDLNLDDWIAHLKKHAIATQIPKPTMIHHRRLEQANLLQREVINGVPQIKVNLLDSCEYDGCTRSHNGIHSRVEVKTVKDLKEYVPVMIEDDQGNESEDLSKRPADLIIDEDGLWQPIEHEYKFGVPCPYCGQVNKYLLRFKQSGLTADAIGKHVDNFNFDSEPGLREKAMSFVKGDIRGGLLYGQPGNGKTHLLCAIAREFIWNNKKVRYVSHQSILEQIRQSFDKGSNIIDPRYSWLDGIDVVLFDELGFFRKNDWSKQTTNELIHALHAANVQVIFASNLTPKQLKAQILDIRSISRISEMCKDFKHEMIGKDQRASEDFWT